MMMSTDQFKKRFLEIQAKFSEMHRNTASILIMGQPGTGKTFLAGTAPRPILIDQFDPGGSKTVQHLIDKGDVIVRNYSGDNRESPQMYMRWEAQFQADIKDGFFNHVGTYVLDSMTTFMKALQNQVLKTNKVKRSFDNVAVPADYGVMQSIVTDVLGRACSLPCHFLCVTHLRQEKDEVSGRIYNQIDLFNSLRSQVPALFDEKYVTVAKSQFNKSKYFLLTANTGNYMASTRSAPGILKSEEENPNLTELLGRMKYDNKSKEV